MSSNHWHSRQTQIFWCCKALLEGRKITHKTEIREVNGWRLGAMVHRLKDEFGWPIRTEYRGAENYAYYWLPESVDRSKLNFPKSALALGAEWGAA
ncbi:hypothetical protein [Aliiruegeria sabulilitoris]|uniref:hypothetical protein n=1 Tax=Aliiruegeria sabulilitoris TaxID=1510458 RepID=UPI0008318045|nr:hypothetical protein [Aliiruegeria sabulilitoris]NDR58657.1 hypothetical protein [Pseudoruegeria sp. M32A2M]